MLGERTSREGDPLRGFGVSADEPTTPGKHVGHAGTLRLMACPQLKIARAVITLDEVAVMHRLTRAQRAT
jgi:hypothetical protein